MLALDFIIANDDRHFHNFGAVRNAETLEWIGIAPIFDCGNSMWHDNPINKIEIEDVDTPSRTFKKNHKEQIKLVKSFDWLNAECLKKIPDICIQVYSQNPFMDEYRLNKLCKAMKVRVNYLEDIIMKEELKKDIGSITME